MPGITAFIVAWNIVSGELSWHADLGESVSNERERMEAGLRKSVDKKSVGERRI